MAFCCDLPYLFLFFFTAVIISNDNMIYRTGLV